jgi:hypothetical protein
MRIRIAALAVILSTSFAGFAHAQGDGIAGHWKFTFLQGSESVNFWMFDFENKDGNLSGVVQPIKADYPSGKISGMAIDGDLLRFVLKLENGIELNFEGKLPRAGGKKILGSVRRGANVNPAYLEATQAKNALELKQEMVTRTPNDPRVFGTLLELIPLAAKEKVAPRDVQEMVDGVLASAASYGPSFQSNFDLRLLDALAESYPAVALDAASKIEKAIEPKGDVRLHLLSTLESSLRKLGQAEQAAKVAAMIDAAEEPAFKDYAANEIDFKVPVSTAKATRPVLVELFTGAQCPPCVGADLAFDALAKAYSDDQAVLLQYHLHIPGPDPLTSPASIDRADSFGENLRSTPTVFLNGKYIAKGGATREDAEEKFKEYSEFVDQLMKSPVTYKIAATAVRKGDVITIKGSVEGAGDAKKAKLRFVLSEDWVRYKGGNGVRYHRNVVRAMPGGADGFGVDPKGIEKEVTVDIAKLRTELNEYLDAFAVKAAKEDIAFPSPHRPMRMQDLHVVAFVQSDETGEVLAVTRVPVKTEGK